MRRTTLFVALSIVQVLGCSDRTPLEVTSSESRLDTATAARLHAELPFKGQWQTTLDNFDPVQGTIEIHGIGVATHLGLSSFDTVQPLAPYVPFDATLNAANGDKLYYTAIGDPVENPEEDPFSFTGTLEFDGGTGRFENATGSAVFEGTASLVTMTGQVRYVGRISY